MRYPIDTPTVIDVTNPPYGADRTGVKDCTEILRRVFNDILIREIEGVKETEKRLLSEHTDLDIFYLGFENRRRNHTECNVIYPEMVPPRRIIYFPAGTYLVSDTVTYTLPNLQNIWHSKPFMELTRGIHLMGEGRDRTVIRLADHSKGFGAGCEKPVISYTNAEGAMERERSNVSQLNTFTDLSVDCGSGNPGAVGLRFVANNSGRVENVAFYGNSALCAMQLVVSTEGVFRNINIDGFEIGITTSRTSLCVFENLIFADIAKYCVQNRNAHLIFWNAVPPKIPFYDCFPNAINTEFHFVTPEATENGTKDRLYRLVSNGICKGQNEIYKVGLAYQEIPQIDFEITKEKIAFVDDYGAIGDGKTDCTQAIQAAFDSGREVVLFGSGHYLVNGKIFVPDTVRLVDFMFCDLFAGSELIDGKSDALFVINGESERPLHFEHLYTFEQFYGHFRFVCHAAKRTLVMKDIHTQAAAMYDNTVSGGKVYFDNCACTTGTYSMNTILDPTRPPEYCGMIPYEFHGQQVWAYNLNPERADLECLNDASDMTVFGLKVEGPGTAVKTVNGGETRVFVHTAGIGNPAAENALFEADGTSKTTVLGGSAFAMLGENVEQEYRRIFRKTSGNEQVCLFRGKTNPFAFDINEK